jgi:GGDEF domain-containing protein
LSENNYDIVIERIKNVFDEEPHINTRYEIRYSISLGHVKYPDHGTDAKFLIERALQETLK